MLMNDNEKEINSFFSPEFRNRLDAIINFDKLGKKESIKNEYMMIDENIELIYFIANMKRVIAYSTVSQLG